MAVDNDPTRAMVADVLAGAELPEGMAEAIGPVIAGMEPDRLLSLMSDAFTAKSLLDAGRTDAALEIIGRYRNDAATYGLADVFDEMVAGVMSSLDGVGIDPRTGEPFGSI